MVTHSRQNTLDAGSGVKTAAQTRTKDSDAPAHTPDAAPVVTRFSVMLAHVTWFFLGPAALLLILFRLGHAETGWVAGLNAAYFAVVALTACCRWFDQRSGQATTSDGEASTWADCRRYVVGLSVVAVVAWVAANLIGNHFGDLWGGS